MKSKSLIIGILIASISFLVFALVWSYMLEVPFSSFFRITTIESLGLRNSDSIITEPFHALKYLIWFAHFVFMIGVLMQYWGEKEKHTSKSTI